MDGSDSFPKRNAPSDTLALPELLATSSGDIPPAMLKHPDASAYLGYLTNLSLHDLQSEPTSLSSSSAQLTNALTTLCHTSYPTFLSLHATASTLTTSISSLSSSLDSLLSILPSLESSARTFAQETREIQKERRKASLVLEHHDKLYDVLSLPMLLDSCIRNHNYNEALLLASHASTLSQRFSHNSLIQSVRAECDGRVQAMLVQLLGVLSDQAKLPALFRAVNFLRKMEVMDEQELALAFLSGRGAYLDRALSAVETEMKGTMEGDQGQDREAPARYLKRYVDIWREGVQDVISQYNTIFLERAPSTSSATTPTLLHMLLSTFATYRIQSLLDLLRQNLPMISDPAHLTALLTQLTYCSTSFARLGLDFRGFLAPIFVDAVRTGIKQGFEAAADAWCAPLTTTGKPGKSVQKPSQLLVASSAVSSLPKPTPAQLQALLSNPVNVPPQVLASYPHLAVYLNAILTALNSLRMLAPVELMGDILAELEITLAKSGLALLRYARDKPWKTLKRSSISEEPSKEDEIIDVTMELYFTVLVPFVRRALVEGVYSSSMEGVHQNTVSELEQVVNEWKEIRLKG
ncbi:Dor1-domain-containing protein [Cristinia sonorae]|uniref:Conserved oligomeric Golgi complex subunit 8 n=1 Tax=Cristinia sonorae TaxID=1940300 RepID=A0A8K0UJV0_9AGAR|nr:Dor1-domain-containing protein [Cristinia sonorae]